MSVTVEPLDAPLDAVLSGVDTQGALSEADYHEPMRKLRMIVGCTERATPGAGNLLNEPPFSRPCPAPVPRD